MIGLERRNRTPNKPVYTSLDSDAEGSESGEEVSDFEVENRVIISDSEEGTDDEVESDEDEDEDMEEEIDYSSDESNKPLRRGRKKRSSSVSKMRKAESSNPKNPKNQKLLTKPTLPQREIIRTNPNSELEKIREKLHVSYVPDDLPGRGDEFDAILEYVSEAIEKGGGECICKYYSHYLL
jgi:hypothetical protein